MLSSLFFFFCEWWEIVRNIRRFHGDEITDQGCNITSLFSLYFLWLKIYSYYFKIMLVRIVLISLAVRYLVKSEASF